MNCEKITEIMQATLDEGPGARPAAAVREHLADCARCRRAWDEACAIEDALGELARAGDARPSDALHRKIMAGVREEQRRLAAAPAPRRDFSVPRRWAAAAALLAGAGLCWLALPHHSDTAPDPAPATSTASGWLQAEPLEAGTIQLASLFEAPKQDFKELAGSILSTATPLLGIVERVQRQDDVKDKLSASRERAD